MVLFLSILCIDDGGREASSVKQSIKLLYFVGVNRQFSAVGDCGFCDLFVSVCFWETAGSEEAYIVRDNAVCAGIDFAV